MGYIEDRKAEGERKALEAAKSAELGRALNQGIPSAGLAQAVAQPYVSGISQEDAYKLALAKQAQEANIRAAYDKVNAVKDAEMLKNYQTSQSDMRDINVARGLGYDKNPVLDPTSPIGQRVDPGLAAKYIQMQEAYDRYK